MSPQRLITTVCLMLFSITSFGATQSSEQQAIDEFVTYMADEHNMDQAVLNDAFEEFAIRSDVLEAIQKPAEYLPWYRYRPIFITPARITQGVSFWQQHADSLTKAEQIYGVPPEIIVAIIGVETFYGQYTGDYPVFDTLTTLAFYYPPRASFFKQELEQLLLLANEEDINPRTLTGSYAGAMGIPQFIASSYRHYAIDFTNDGKRDLLGNETDAIGSVGNYFSQHGWQQDAPIVLQATVNNNDYTALISDELKPETSLATWKKAGIDSDPIDDQEALATLVELETTADDNSLWLGLHNFYVITRYNHSALYAMAVYELSEAIKAEMEQAST